jgi:hypothetical protein
MIGPKITTKMIVPVISALVISSARLLVEVLPKKPPITPESPVPMRLPIYIMVMHIQKHFKRVKKPMPSFCLPSLGSFLIISKSTGKATRYNGKNDTM